MSDREEAMIALAALLQSSYPWASPVSRRLKLWAEVPAAQRPACFLFEGGSDRYDPGHMGTMRRDLMAKVFVYTNSRDKSTIGSTQLNTILDAIDAALRPKGADMATGRNSLGGKAYWCRIEGTPMKEPGDLDGDGLLVIPLVVTLP